MYRIERLWIPCGVSYVVQCLHKDFLKLTLCKRVVPATCVLNPIPFSDGVYRSLNAMCLAHTNCASSVLISMYTSSDHAVSGICGLCLDSDTFPKVVSCLASHPASPQP